MDMVQSRPITVVIPLVEAHDHHLADLFQTLAAEAALIREVVVARSLLSRQLATEYSSWAHSLGHEHQLQVRVVATGRRATAGENRNRGWAEATTKYVAFMDADDLYVSGRLGAMLSVADGFESNLVLHDFWASEATWHESPRDEWGLVDVVHTDDLFAATFPAGRDRGSEGLVPGDTNIIVPSVNGASSTVHHGHTLVRTSVIDAVRFGRRYPGEDGQFCRDVLWNLGKVDYIPARLSIYRSELTAESHTGLWAKSVRRLRSVPELGINAFRG